MTEKEKAKAYDEAIEKAKEQIKECGDNEGRKRMIRNIFPELAESEEERIRQWLYDVVDNGAFLAERPCETEKILAYLEKQKDILINRAEYITTCLLEDRIIGIQQELIEFLANNTDTSWTDITKSADSYAQRIMSKIEKQKEQKPILFKNKNLSELIKAEFEGFRNLLKKNGLDYEPQQIYWDDFARLFDSSAREYLKEQNLIPSDSVGLEKKSTLFIPKFRVGDKLISTMNNSLTYDILEVGHINELGNLEYKVEIFRDGKPDNPHNIHYIECRKVDRWTNLIEQKPAEWSEEDEKMFNDTLTVVRLSSCGSSIDVDKWLRKRFKFLRPQPQGVYKTAIESIRKMCDSYEKKGIFTDERAIDFLGNVRVKCKDAIECAPILDEHQWKPSEEQMVYLKEYVDRLDELDTYNNKISHKANVFYSLYQDLKKLT